MSAPLLVRAQDEAEHVKETDANAVEVGYRQNSSTVDETKFPNHTSDQKCARCILFNNPTGAPWAGCIVFLPKLVAATGWCNQWFQRPA
jgi:hypothetical protein